MFIYLPLSFQTSITQRSSEAADVDSDDQECMSDDEDDLFEPGLHAVEIVYKLEPVLDAAGTVCLFCKCSIYLRRVAYIYNLSTLRLSCCV